MGNITGKTTIPSTGVNGYLAGNDSIDQVDLALTDSLTVLVDDGNAATITDVDPTYNFSRNILFVLSDDSPVPDAAITITIPATKRGQFVVKNTTSFDATITISGQGESADTVAAGTSSVFSSDGSNVRVAGSQGTTTFTGLSDTPANYTGDSLKYLRVNSGETAVEATAVAPGAAIAVAPRFRGCVAYRATDQSAADYDPAATIPFDGELYDTDGFHSTSVNTSRMTIPASSGITRVRLTGGIRLIGANSNFPPEIYFFKNGLFPTVVAITMSGPVGAANNYAVLPSYVIDATDGDYFEIRLGTVGDSSVDVMANSTWFALEVVETSEAVFPPESLKAHVTTADKLVTSSSVAIWLADREISLADDFAGSLGRAASGPNGGSVVFDVDIEGSTVGTITFADSSGAAQTATFATTGGTTETVAVGERIEIVSPANIQSMDDVAFTLQAWRS